MPALSEDQLATAVPYFSVVQSLRDTAKDAIVRRLELEAKATEAESNVEEEGKGRRAVEEVRLREELRHARLLADTFQARTLELEKDRINLEDQVRRHRLERDNNELRSQKLNNEVKRLRADADVAKKARQQWESESLQLLQQVGVVALLAPLHQCHRHLAPDQLLPAVLVQGHLAQRHRPSAKRLEASRTDPPRVQEAGCCRLQPQSLHPDGMAQDLMRAHPAEPGAEAVACFRRV